VLRISRISVTYCSYAPSFAQTAPCTHEKLLRLLTFPVIANHKSKVVNGLYVAEHDTTYPIAIYK